MFSYSGLAADPSEAVRQALASGLSQLECVFCRISSSTAGDALPFSHPACSICERTDPPQPETASVLLLPPDQWQRMFKLLLFEEVVSDVQTEFLESIPRVLKHASAAQLAVLKDDLVRCLDTLPLHASTPVRAAFSRVVGSFVACHVLHALFGSEDLSQNGTRLLDKFKQGLAVTDELDVRETLLSGITAVATASGPQRQLLFFALILLIEQLDYDDPCLRVSAVAFIKQVAVQCWPTADGGSVQAMIEAYKSDLASYLCARLVTRPAMVAEFSEAVVGLDLTHFLVYLTPAVLPNLVLEQGKSLGILQELARRLGADVPLLLLTYCHRVSWTARWMCRCQN